MTNRHPAPGKAKVVERLLPKWKLRRRQVERLKRRPGKPDGVEILEVIDRLPADGLTASFTEMAQRLNSRIEAAGDPAPPEQMVVDRLRHILRHVDADHQMLVLLSSPVPPYFGVTTAKGRGVEIEEAAT